MTCYSPLKGWRSRGLTDKGKRRVVFNLREAYSDLKVDVPCGQCIGCKMARSKQWAVRCVHESSLHRDNCFVTLTYNSMYLPADGALDKRDVQLFLKRLRKAVEPLRIRYFCCGEYGASFGRPHYHVLIFGYDFVDKYLWSDRDGVRLYRSPLLESIWTVGNSTVGNVTYDSAAYVARYCVKPHYNTSKDVLSGKHEAIYNGYQAEFCTMSRRPGIARQWIERYHKDVYPHDFVVVGFGKRCKPARYYDNIYDVIDRKSMHGVHARRKSKAMDMAKSVDSTPERLHVRERVQIAEVVALSRVLH